MMPLRWRLTLWHMGLVALGLGSFVLISYQVLADSLRAEIDRTLEERAHHVADAIALASTLPTNDLPDEAKDEFNSPGVYVQVFNADGAVIAHSHNLGAQSLPLAPTDLQRVLSGGTFYATTQLEGQPVRLYHQPLELRGAITGVAQVGQSLAGLESVLRRLRDIYAGGMAAVLLFAALGGWALARLGLQPVTRVTQAAREVVRAEDLSRRVAHSGPADEVGTLATTFNEMLDRLQVLFESQRRFLAEAAHELRTPLASMLGNVDLLARFGEEPERRQTTVAALQRTGRHVARLLDDLLLLAQAETGWHLQLQPVAIDDIFIEAYEAARPLAPGIELHLQACDPAYVRGDPDRLQQVFTNLIDNAVKHAPPQSAILLSLWRAEGKVWVQIEDTGPGISPEALPHIFESFFRERASDHSLGTGLGLAIVHWIVCEHGGEITVESQVGQGTTVRIALPEYLVSG